MEWVQHFHENVCALSEAKGMYKTMKNIVAATLRLITIGLLLMLVGLAMISTAAAQLETFLVRASDGSYYQYHSEALNRAYLRRPYQRPAGPAGL